MSGDKSRYCRWHKAISAAYSIHFPVAAGRSLFLSGQSSVGLSFDQPAESIESIVHGALNLLEAARFIGRPIRIYNASSSDASAM